MRAGVWVLVGVVGLVACEPATRAPPETPRAPSAVSGSALLVGVSPTGRPRLRGDYDFELLGQGRGKACITRAANTYYWVGLGALSELSTDRLTRQAIAAAALDAVTRLDDADTILLTSVFTSSEDATQTCATVVGRGVRLKKAESSTLTTPVPSPAPVPAGSDLLPK